MTSSFFQVLLSVWPQNVSDPVESRTLTGRKAQILSEWFGGDDVTAGKGSRSLTRPKGWRIWHEVDMATGVRRVRVRTCGARVTGCA